MTPGRHSSAAERPSHKREAAGSSPAAGTIPEVEQAFREGAAAHAAGTPAESNPYSDWTRGAAWSVGHRWASGWRPGERRRADDRDCWLMWRQLGLSRLVVAGWVDDARRRA